METAPGKTDRHNKTRSTSFVFSDPLTGEWVYFQGTDKKLWKVRGDSAGTDLTQIGSNKTNSTPFVTFDSSTGDVWAYFQGTDNKLWKVKNDGAGSDLTQIGANKTSSTPFVFADPITGEWVYFQGTDNKLWKVRGDSAGADHDADRHEHDEIDAVRHFRQQRQHRMGLFPGYRQQAVESPERQRAAAAC